MEELFEMFRQVSSEVWRNYKRHLDTYNPSNSSEFWESWQSDIDVLDNAYNFEEPKGKELTEEELLKKARYFFFRYFMTALYDGMAIGMGESNGRSS